MKLPGKLSISHPSGMDSDYIEIRVQDGVSGISFLELRIAPANFANAITGISYEECSLELRGLEHLGFRREHKREVVPYKAVYGEYEKPAKAKALAPFEVDGWKGNASDLGNHHRGNDTDGYSVLFARFVPNEEPQSSKERGA